MLSYSWLIENHEFIKLLFTLNVAIISFIIVFKTHKMYHLSEHEGIRYFRNAFLCYGLAFLLRYLVSVQYDLTYGHIVSDSFFMGFRIAFVFFMVMASFFLFYSLLFKRFTTKNSHSSLFNARIFIFYALALIIGILDFILGNYSMMFFSQIIIFSFAGGVAFEKYGQVQKKSGFLGLYLWIILLIMITRILNFIVSYFLVWNKYGVIGIYLLDAIIFLLFLYGIIKVTRRS